MYVLMDWCRRKVTAWHFFTLELRTVCTNLQESKADLCEVQSHTGCICLYRSWWDSIQGLTYMWLEVRMCDIMCLIVPCMMYIYIYIYTHTHFFLWLCQTNGTGCCGWLYKPYALTHWVQDKSATISQMTFSNAFSWMRMYAFHWRFPRCLFLRFQLSIFQHWFR